MTTQTPNGTKPQHRMRLPMLAALAVALGLVLAACNGGGGLSQSEVDSLRQQVEAMEQRLDNVAMMVEDLRQDVDGEAEARLEEVRSELDETLVILDGVRAELAAPPPPEADPALDPAAPPPAGTPASPGF
jgi:hypothetical protein